MRTRRSLLWLLATSCTIAVACRVSAQATCISFPDASLTTGVSSTVPFGDRDANDKFKANQYLQFIIPGAMFGTSPIDLRSIAFVPMSDREHVFGELAVTLQHTSLSKPTTNLIANGSGGKGGLRYQSVVIEMQGKAWNRIPLDFRFDPSRGNLLVSLYAIKAESIGSGDTGFLSDPSVDSVYVNGFNYSTGITGSLHKGAPKVQFCVDAPVKVHFLDSGCRGSNAKTPRLSVVGAPSLGQSFDVRLTNAQAASSFAVLVWSWRSLGWTLPGGCVLRPHPDFINGVALQNGAGSFVLGVPNDTALLSGSSLVFQYYAHDPQASSLGFAGSTWAELRIGQ
ncbi:MAG: hypothetical protein H6832_00155 [Planctomycetes bacterium]|nr:hypothetical protein [Planctomycetota bacterium]MCB9916794.1 hypothetical protein [Planctomycetota bacterium]